MSEETGATSWLACGDATARDRRNLGRYQLALVLFALVYLAANYLVAAGQVPPGGAGWLVAIIPSAVALLPVAAFVRFLSEADELQRVIQLQALALGFAAGFVLWPSIRLLERLGTPVSQWHTVLPMAIIAGYVVGIALNRRRFR